MKQDFELIEDARKKLRDTRNSHNESRINIDVILEMVEKMAKKSDRSFAEMTVEQDIHLAMIRVMISDNILLWNRIFGLEDIILTFIENVGTFVEYTERLISDLQKYTLNRTKEMIKLHEDFTEKNDVSIIPNIYVTQTNIQEQKGQHDIKIDVNNEKDLAVLQSDFHKFKEEMEKEKLDKDSKNELEDIEKGLQEVIHSSEKSNTNGFMEKLSTFMRDVGDSNSKFNKIIKGSRKGVELFQKVGKTYNKCAEWSALPQIPDVFL